MKKIISLLVYHLQNLLAKDYHDEFIVRLRQVNTGLLRKGNALAFYNALKAMPEGDVLEIGTFTGCTANLLAHFARIHGRKPRIVTCDPWNYSFKNLTGKVIPNTTIGYDDWAQFARDTASRNINFFSQGAVHAFQTDSLSLLKAWHNKAALTDLNGQTVALGGPIAFAFIDGNHDYGPVKADLEAVIPLLAPGGYLFLDDSAWLTGSPGVGQLMSERGEWAAAAGLQLVARYPNLLFRKKLN